MMGLILKMLFLSIEFLFVDISNFKNLVNWIYLVLGVVSWILF